jgi:hypothetical protein
MDFGCPELESVFQEYSDRVELAVEEGRMENAEAFIVIEDWQEGLKKITTRILWDDPKTGDPKEYDRDVFIHMDRER